MGEQTVGPHHCILLFYGYIRWRQGKACPVASAPGVFLDEPDSPHFENLLQPNLRCLYNSDLIKNDFVGLLVLQACQQHHVLLDSGGPV